MLSTNPVVCPQYLLNQAQAHPAVPTAVVKADSPGAMQSAQLAVKNHLIDPVLIGNKDDIQSLAKQIEWNLSDIRLIDTADESNAAETAVTLAQNQEVTALMKGNIHTDTLLRAILTHNGGLTTGRRLSHVFHMSVPQSEQALCISDAVINVQPDVPIKLDIARNVTRFMHTIGNPCPKVAVLSASEVATPSMPSSMEAAEVVRLAEDGEVEGAILGGPFAFDNAVSAKAAKIKGINHPVAGQANVLLVPNIETGNALFKQMVYFMGATAAGLVLGATVPIILTSRADPPAARLASSALASIYAHAL